MNNDYNGVLTPGYFSPHYMPNGNIMPELLNEQEALIFLRLEKENNPERTLKYYRDKGQLRGLKIGTNFLYPKRELLKFIEVATEWFNRNKNPENIS
jgi:hypothetical protein